MRDREGIGTKIQFSWGFLSGGMDARSISDANVKCMISCVHRRVR